MRLFIIGNDIASPLHTGISYAHLTHTHTWCDTYKWVDWYGKFVMTAIIMSVFCQNGDYSIAFENWHVHVIFSWRQYEHIPFECGWDIIKCYVMVCSGIFASVTSHQIPTNIHININSKVWASANRSCVWHTSFCLHKLLELYVTRRQPHWYWLLIAQISRNSHSHITSAQLSTENGKMMFVIWI